MSRWGTPAPASAIGAAIATAGVVFVLYVLTMPTVLPESGDAMAQTGATLRQPIELNPHHLLVVPADRFALALSRAFSAQVPPFLPIQVLNSLAGAAACGLFLFWLTRLAIPPAVAIPYTFALALTFVHWLHSREAEVGILANLFLLVTLNLLPLATNRRSSIFVAAGSAVLTILSALNTAILAPAFGVMDLVDSERRARRRLLTGFLAATAVGVVVSFIILPWMTTGTPPRDLLAQMASHPSTVRLAERGQLSFANVLRAGSGLINSFTGDTAVTTALKARLLGKAVIPLSSWDWIRFGLGALLALHLLLALFDRPQGGRERALWLATWAALLPTALFNLLWLGSDPQFWLPLLPFLGAWSATWLVRNARPRRAGAPPGAQVIVIPAVAALVLAIVNWPNTVPTALNPRGGPQWQMARAFADVAKPGDLLLHNGGFGPYLQAMGFDGAVSLVWTLPVGKEEYERALYARVDSTHVRGGRVYAQNVFGKVTAATVGGWEEIQAISGHGHEEWLGMLRSRYDIRPTLPPIYGDLWDIRARAPGNDTPGNDLPGTSVPPPAARSETAP